MTALELHSLLAGPTRPILLQVLPAEVFVAEHIAGSINACVYETAFVSNVKDAVPDPNQPIVVYGMGEGAMDAETARYKLLSAGYTDVQAFTGGLSEWLAGGLPIEGTRDLPSQIPVHGCFRVNAADSVIRWTGRNLFNHHHGTVKLAEGSINVSNGSLTDAELLIDMASIACDDLAGSEWHDVLVRHLHDADFFLVSKYPTARLVIDSAKQIPGATEGQPTHLLTGSLTLRGVTRPLEFPAVIGLSDTGRLTGQAQFEIDRTEFGSQYGSGRFFRFLGKHAVNDLVHLHVKIHADSGS